MVWNWNARGVGEIGELERAGWAKKIPPSLRRRLCRRRMVFAFFLFLKRNQILFSKFSKTIIINFLRVIFMVRYPAPVPRFGETLDPLEKT